jgi:hypothetical protein
MTVIRNLKGKVTLAFPKVLRESDGKDRWRPSR